MLKKFFSIIVTCICFLLTQNLEAQPDYETRKQNFIKHMNNGVALIWSSNRHNELNKNFYYLTGSRDSTKILLVYAQGKNKSELISIDDFEDELSNGNLRRKLEGNISNTKELWVSFDDLNKIENLRNSFTTKTELKNSDYLFYQLREIKDSYEQELISKAVKITSEAYNHILEILKPGWVEQDLIDAFKNKQKELGAQSTSFIQAGSGANGTQVHAEPTDKIIEDGELVVFDVGAWYEFYTSDISRTYPANGIFTKPQKEIYELVLKAQKAGIARMVPEQVMLNVQQEVENILIDGLYNLGLITDKSCQWQRKLYLVHGYYHYIGLDIHDCYPFMHKEIATKKYKPGMIMTMEPGLYFPPTLLDKKPRDAKNLTDQEFNTFVKTIRKNFTRYQNIGVRIEDDILITKTGNVVLSREVPKEIDEIEKAMK